VLSAWLMSHALVTQSDSNSQNDFIKQYEQSMKVSSNEAHLAMKLIGLFNAFSV